MSDGNRYLGRHILLDFKGCDARALNDLEKIREAMLRAARESGATIVTDVFHRFNPHGISGVVVIAESHLAIHTWPEFGCASVDIFSCSSKMRPEVIQEILRSAFSAVDIQCTEIPRGRL